MEKSYLKLIHMPIISKLRPDNASKYFDISGFHWNDAPWYAYKKAHPHEQSPVNIYEVHAGLLATV